MRGRGWGIVLGLLVLVTSGCSSGGDDGEGEARGGQGFEPVDVGVENLALDEGLFAPPRPMPPYEVALDEQVRRGGTGSGRLRSVAEPTGPEANRFGTLTRCMPAQPFLGGKVRYSGWLKTEQVNGFAGLWLRVDGPPQGDRNQTLGFDNMKDRGITGTVDWRSETITLDVPAAAKQMCFGFLLAGTGTVWADELRFERSCPASTGCGPL